MKNDRNSVETRIAIKSAFSKIVTGKTIAPNSIRGIQIITGFSPGTIYYHFKNKAELILEIIDDYWKKCLLEIDNIDDSIDPVLGIRKLYDILLFRFKIFQTYWIKEVLNLDASNKEVGKSSELKYLTKIKNKIESILRTNENFINKDTIHALGIERLCKFIVNTLLNSMKQNDDEEDFIFIISKIIL